MDRLRNIIALSLALALLFCAVGCEGSLNIAREKEVAVTMSPNGTATGYTDVPEDAWYADAAVELRQSGVMQGTGDGTFSPDDSFMRAQLATVLYRLAGEPEVSGKDSFYDTDMAAWYADAVLWAEQSGVVNGMGNGRFAPNDPVTQEQLVTMLWRMAGEPNAEPAEDASPYAAQAVGWARESGVAADNADYTFTPRAKASRAQVAALLANFLPYDAAEATG